MAKFHDAMAALQGIEGDLPGDMWEQLTGAYDEDIAGVGTEISDTAAAKVAELTAEMADMTKALQAAKAHNYELLMSAPAEGSEDEPTGDEDTDNEDAGIDSLFEDEKEEN